MPPVLLLLSDAESSDNNVVNAVINPSRTDCASPCTVVFSADKTTAQGLDAHGIWSQLSYYWDFDTDETDTYGVLYDQTYTYVPGDTSFEKGHVPMVTKTFVCATQSCVYNVGMRAQNSAGDYDDAFVSITVHSEPVQWSAANTVCVSNTLDVSSDWTVFDKACPAGATKQTTFPLPDQFDNKLVLVKRGDVFDDDDIFPTQFGETRLGIQNGPPNYKIGNFGDAVDPFPDLQAILYSGVAVYQMSGGVVSSLNLSTSDSHISSNGWSNNAYFEGLRIGGFSFPESFVHIGLHDIDMDMETSAVTNGGRIGFSGGVRCTDLPDRLDCANIPFPRGGYISKVDVVGGTAAQMNSGATLNVAGVGCSMVNFTGIVDSRFRKAGEHNLRIMGWWRLNIMRNFIRGQHYSPTKQKLTLRPCVEGDLDNGLWRTHAGLPTHWRSEIQGRTRADTYLDNNTDQYLHLSRYQVINGNLIGDKDVLGTHTGERQYQTNALGGDNGLLEDIAITQNTFENEQGETVNANVDLSAHYSICVDNTYTISAGCVTDPADTPGVFVNPVPIPAPLKPVSLP